MLYSGECVPNVVGPFRAIISQVNTLTDKDRPMTRQQQTTKTTEYAIGLDGTKFALYRTRTWNNSIRFTDRMFSSRDYKTVAIMLQAVGS